MRYRALDAAGDMTFGQGGLNFLVDSAEAVVQAVTTRLLLEAGEWFLDVTEGTDYQTQVLGYGTAPTRDIEIRNRILGTQGVTEIVEYSSSVSSDRVFSVRGSANSFYGPFDLASAVPPILVVPSLDFRNPNNSQYVPGL